MEKINKMAKIGILNNNILIPNKFIIIIIPPKAKIISAIIEQIGRSKFTAAKLLELIRDSLKTSIESLFL